MVVMRIPIIAKLQPRDPPQAAAKTSVSLPLSLTGVVAADPGRLLLDGLHTPAVRVTAKTARLSETSTVPATLAYVRTIRPQSTLVVFLVLPGLFEREKMGESA